MARLAVLATVLLSFLGASRALVKNYTLSSFTGVSLQLPLYGQINVTSGSTYAATINATDALVNNASVAVSDGLLTVALLPNANVNAQYTTPQTISITVPSQSLTSVALQGSTALAVDGAAIASNMTLSTSSSGTGTISIANATTSAVNSQASGQGVTIVTGKLGAVSYSASGQGSGYFVGNVSSLNVSLTGQCNVQVSSTASPVISGQASGQTAVIYDKGTCNVSVSGTPACQQQSNITLPGPIVAPTSGSISVGSGSSGTGGALSSGSPSSATSFGSGAGTVFSSSSVSSG